MRGRHRSVEVKYNDLVLRVKQKNLTFTLKKMENSMIIFSSQSCNISYVICYSFIIHYSFIFRFVFLSSFLSLLRLIPATFYRLVYTSLTLHFFPQYISSL